MHYRFYLVMAVLVLVGLEAIVLSLAAARPQAALASLDKLNRLRRATEAQDKLQK